MVSPDTMYDNVLTQGEEQFNKDNRRIKIVLGALLVPIFGVILFFGIVGVWHVYPAKPLSAILSCSYNLGIFSAQFIPYAWALFISLFSLLIFNLIVLSGIYFCIVLRDWRYLLVFVSFVTIAFGLSSSYLQSFRDDCTQNYVLVQQYAGQTLPFEQLKTDCGNPVFYRNNGSYSHWVYTDGNKAFAVFPIGEDQVRVSETSYWFFD